MIRNNTVRRNGWPTDPYRANGWLWDAGIGIHASPDVEVYGNTLNENFNGIVAIQQPRERRRAIVRARPVGSSYRTCTSTTTSSISARRRRRTATVEASGAANDAGDTAIFTSRNNRWVRNTYYTGTNARPFAWMNGFRTAAEWRAYGQDATGSFNP